jgi:hypothetical protein
MKNIVTAWNNKLLSLLIKHRADFKGKPAIISNLLGKKIMRDDCLCLPTVILYPSPFDNMHSYTQAHFNHSTHNIESLGLRMQKKIF